MLQIGEVAGLLGITAKAIRHYHQLGLVSEPPRAANGYRLYGAAELARLQRILRLQTLGLSLRQIGFILDADQPDTVLKDLLTYRQQSLTSEIERLRHQQTLIETFLSSNIPVETILEPADVPSSAAIIHSAMRSTSNGMADIIVAAEGDVLHQLDQYDWGDSYEQFWDAFARTFAQRMYAHQHAFILWMERYIALGGMAEDDLQAQAWLKEFAHSGDRRLFSKVWRAADAVGLNSDDHTRMQRLFGLLILSHGTRLQQQFISMVFTP